MIDQIKDKIIRVNQAYLQMNQEQKYRLLPLEFFYFVV
jgi:hypothetical protein